MVMIYQPQGTGTPVKHGSIVVNAPVGAKSGSYQDSNYIIDDDITNLPATGTVNSKYDGRFDDTTYYTA